MSNVDVLIGKFADKQVAERYAKAAGEAKRVGKSSCIVDNGEWSVLDITNALLRSGNGVLARNYGLAA